MSWIKQISRGGEEDVFDEYGDDTSLQNREWSSNMKKRIRVELLMFHHILQSPYGTGYMNAAWDVSKWPKYFCFFSDGFSIK